MILQCNFEEIRALAAGAELVFAHEPTGESSAVAAPAEAATQIEQLLPRLTGDISIHTLADQQQVRAAVAAICGTLHERLEARVLEYHPAHEEAVAYYFDYAHSRTVLHRLDSIGAEMNAMIELMTGAPATAESARAITFAD